MNDSDILSQNIDEILKRSSTSDTEFLAHISHEMRTPLNGIIGVIDLMSHEEQSVSPNFEIYLKNLEQSCRTLLSVVYRLQDISDLQTIKSPQQSLEVIEFDLETVLTGVSQNMQFYNSSSDKETQLEIIFDKRIPRMIEADLTKIQQIMTNLCAIGAFISTDRYVTVELDLKYLDKTDCVINTIIKSGKISVKENFDLRDIYPLIFENSDMFDTTKMKNMVIGVNICRRFVQELGSQLHIEKVKDQLHFSFTLNVVPKSTPKGNPKPLNSSTPEEIKKIHILLADDNSVNIMIVSKMARYLGVTYSTASNGEEVLKKMVKENFTMIFMDLDMPLMDGYDATWHIRNILKNDIPIIALTANSTNEAKKRCIDVGMNDFFTKPVTIHTISEMITKWNW